MNRPLAIPDLLRDAQLRASDPDASAWVSANAGSGKTHVLTQRVLRLLLGGTPPSQILGLTFTKAAAANMAGRIFRTLSAWTSLEDSALAAAMGEAGARADGARGDFTKQQLQFARQLFARTIESPGGLKVQTLHAFCERLLQLFPFEANVPAHFKVVDEREGAALMELARDAALSDLVHTNGSEPLERLAREAGVFLFPELLREAQRFPETFAAFENAADYAAALRSRLGLNADATAARVGAAMFGGDIGRKHRENWAQALEGGSNQDWGVAESLREADALEDAEGQIEALLSAFFKDGGHGDRRAKSKLTTAAVRKAHPRLEDDLLAEQERLGGLRDEWRSARAVERSEALFAVARSVLDAFAHAKAERGALDFSDQTRKALALLNRSSAAWVLHKLDNNVDHLLIDEAQDTSAEQWRIVEALTAELFAGAGARQLKRTVFAVGDEKQSIFSFQGAAPDLFAEMRRWFEKRHGEAKRRFDAVALHFSFRSAQTLLDAVDRTFASPEAWAGVGAPDEPPPRHQAVRSDMKGVVELWPTVPKMAPQEPGDWRMPLDQLHDRAPAAVLAHRIADEIRRWLLSDSPARVLDPRTRAPRPIRAGDVMILVRSRSAFFGAMIRALKDRNVPTAGADRLLLRDHIAVMDLIAAGKAALTPDDDLTLAALLKSPLVGLDEDALFALASSRSGSLDSALKNSVEPAAQAAAERLALWRERARALSPHAFYARLLSQDGGRKALLARLGPDAADPIDEFLALALTHERRNTPSLTRFLAEIEADEAPIKRDMESESVGVRVLTVHGSKGLEAPIVFLPDTCGAPNGQHDPKLLPLKPALRGEPTLFVWSRRKSDDSRPLSAARMSRQQAEAGEHRRLLYVAMTRASERLIVAGYEGSRGRADGCWYNLLAGGFAESMTEAPAPWGGEGTIRRSGSCLSAVEGCGTLQSPAGVVSPAWLREPAPQPRPSAFLRPSRSDAPRPDERKRVTLGQLAHGLLQGLPDIPKERRPEAARQWLASQDASLVRAERDGLVATVLRTLDAPELARLFGQGSRGEVAFIGILRRPGCSPMPYTGRIDRMAMEDNETLIADFKLGAAPVRAAAAHVSQLALYHAALLAADPSKPVRAALVYLDGPTLVRLSDPDLDAAIEAIGRS